MFSQLSPDTCPRYCSYNASVVNNEPFELTIILFVEPSFSVIIKIRNRVIFPRHLGLQGQNLGLWAQKKFLVADILFMERFRCGSQLSSLFR